MANIQHEMELSSMEGKGTDQLIKLLEDERKLYEDKQIKLAIEKGSEEKEAYVKGISEGLSIAAAIISGAGEK
ncbi:hypothetical protein [Bacillus infantis]|uniref:Uncharacterized protein n=1 Tax=Bacillus infantis TaxID=324767 RepID=A0A5D4R3D8_9BACI|nr:hypothetical protein [Bacillus infantis]TYS45865.1 hypothetical protein FZD51_17605 [Bacillus infantis]